MLHDLERSVLGESMEGEGKQSCKSPDEGDSDL